MLRCLLLKGLPERDVPAGGACLPGQGGGFIALLGIGMFALPAGILASGFAREIKRRDFIVSWNMVAGVPLFSTLSATQIADIAKLLHYRKAVPGEVIVAEGNLAESIYFVLSGMLGPPSGQPSFQLREGDFFGETALIRNVPRTATVQAQTSCELLLLEAREFSQLLDANPSLRETVERVIRERRAEMPDG